jgi:hypothetical protein
MAELGGDTLATVDTHGMFVIDDTGDRKDSCANDHVACPITWAQSAKSITAGRILPAAARALLEGPLAAELTSITAFTKVLLEKSVRRVCPSEKT